MIAGPIFSREALTLPRQLRHYLIRSGYIGLLFVLLWTAGQTTFGFQDVRGISAMASFGNLVFQILGFVQLTLVLFFSLLFTAGNISQEKDRQTLILLLMTDLSNREIVLGKLLASLLQVGTLILASVPVFVLLQFFGGVDIAQILWLIAVCVVTAALSGSWAALVAFYREKTFQTLATAVLGVVVYIGFIEAVMAVLPSGSNVAYCFGIFSPFRALTHIMSPLADPVVGTVHGVSAIDSVGAMLFLSVLMTGIAIRQVRVWNPSRAVFIQPEATSETDEAGETRSVVRHRRIWSNPVIWREIMTRAYGRRTVMIKVLYLAIVGFIFYQAVSSESDGELVLGMLSGPAASFLGICLLSLLLINAQAVTAITTERDGKTLDLLVATDVTAKEFVYGKLGGILYNTKELALVPIGIAVWFLASGSMSVEDSIFLTVGLLVLTAFVSMLGLHSGLGFASSRRAIANSMGTVFFLFIGIFILMILLVETRDSFASQFPAFAIFIGVGGVGLVQSLTYHNPSQALRLAGFSLPFITFYALTTFLLEGTLGVCLAVTVAYGFTTLAMLVPAVSEFDTALGRSTFDKG